MKSEIHALIASLVFDQEAPSEIKDFSVFKITESVAELVRTGNDGVAPERKVTLKSALIVAERSLVASANRRLETRAFSLVRDVTNFITLSKEGRVGELSPENTDLLAVGHPLSTAPHSMEEKDFRLARSRWIAADPRISQEHRSLVSSAYAAEPDSLEQDFAIARLQSLPVGSIPSEVIVASAIKSLVASFGFKDGANKGFWRRQWRDRRKRFAKMGRATKVDYKDDNGNVKSFIGPFVGTHTDPNFGKILVKGDPNVPDGIYLAPSSSSEMVMGKLSEDVLKKVGISVSRTAPSSEISKSLDKDIPNLKDIQTLPITEDDSNLAKPIAKLPAGMKAVYGLENVEFDDSPDSFIDKLMFNTEADIDLVDEKLAAFIKKDKSLSKSLDSKKFGKYIDSETPVSDALNDFSTEQLSKKDLQNLLSESSFETGSDSKLKELSNVLQALSDYFDEGYDPKDYLDSPEDAPAAEATPEIDGFDYSKAEDSDYVDAFLDGFDNGVFAREKEEDLSRNPAQESGYDAGQTLGEAKYEESLAKAQEDFPQYGQPERDSESREALNEAREEISKPIYDSLQELQELAKEPAPEATDEEKVIGERFSDWIVPSFGYPIQNDTPYEVSGAIAEVYGDDATDDPKIIANMFDKAQLTDALFEAIAGEDGDGTLNFPEAGQVMLPAEAIYDAMLENNFDADSVVAQAYDAVLGNEQNTKALNSFRKGTAPIGQVAELDKDDIESRTSSELNVAIASQNYAKKASDLVEGFKTLEDSDMDVIVDAINNSDLSTVSSNDYLERPVSKLISEFLPYAFSDEDGKKQAFRGMLGIVALTDGNDNLMFNNTTGIINQIYKNSEFYDDSKSIEENFKVLSDAVYPDGMSYEGFIKSRAKVAIGEEDPNSPESYSGATYKLAGKLAQDYSTRFGFQRGFLTTSDDVLENYTTEGSIVSFDMRPFTEDPSQAQKYAKTLWNSGKPNGIVFKIEGPANGVKTDALTNYFDEKELLVSGDFEISEAKEIQGSSVGETYSGRRVFEVTLKPVAKKEQTIQEPIAEIPQEQDLDLSELSMVYDLKDYSQVSGPLGSNEGGTYQDSTGKQIYVKEPRTDLHGDNEVLASALYQLAGVPAAKVRNGELADGTKVTFSEMIPDSKDDFAEKVEDPEYRKKVQEGFVVDAWLSNWDVAGTGFDNIVSDANDEPVRIDPGGALLFRAQGAPKGNAFNDKVTELDTLVDPSQNQWSAKTFQDMSEEDKVESAKKLLDISEEDIDNYVNASITDEDAKTKLSELLKARRQTIINRYSLEEGAEDGGGESGEPAGDSAGPEGQGTVPENLGPSGERDDGLADSDGNKEWATVDRKVEDNERVAQLKAEGKNASDVYELDSERDAQAFKDGIEKLKEGNPFFASVYAYTVEEYKNMRMFMTADGTAGFAIKGGDDIVSVFVPEGPHKGSARSFIARAVGMGGRRLDAFDTNLPNIYAKEGFVPVARLAWDNDEAPPTWEKEVYSEFNNGEPDVVFMAYDSKRIGSTYDSSEGKSFTEYGDALEAQNQFVEDQKLPSAKEEPSNLTGYSYEQNANGIYYPTSPLTLEDRNSIRSGEKIPPFVPFMLSNTDSGEDFYFDSTGVMRWGQYGASGALLRKQNENGEFEFLITKRSGETSTSPNKWSVPGGSHASLSDKGTQITAKRELSEELGIDVVERAKNTYTSQPAPDWSYSYEMLDVENLKDYDFKLSREILETRWVSANELSQMQADGELHEDFNEEVVSDLIEFSNNNNYSPSTISSTKWWKHDKDENGNLIQFSPKQGPSLQVGDIIRYKMSDFLVTNQTGQNSKYGPGMVSVVNPATGATDVLDLRKQGNISTISNNQSAQQQLKVASGEFAYSPASGQIIDSANVDSPKSKSESGFSNYTLYTQTTASNKSIEVEENVDFDGAISYGVPSEGINIFAQIKPKGEKIFDAYISLNKPELKEKYSFETLEEAKSWVGESLSNSFGFGMNFITGDFMTGEFGDIKTHKGGFLKPASVAQIDFVKKLLETKQIDPELKEKISAQILKDDYVGGEAGAHISQLKALDDLPEEEAQANFATTQDSTLDQSFTPNTSDSEIFVTSPEDELDPAKILDALKKSHLNSYSLDNGDLVIGTREYTTAYNKSYKYEVVVRRTKDQERFFAYVRKTDMQTGDISVLRASKDGHSYKTMMNKLLSVKQGIMVSGDPNTWFNKKKASVENLAPDFDLSEQIDFVVSSNTKEELEGRIKEILATVGGSSFNINKSIISKLEKAVTNGVLSQDYVNEVFQKMISSKIEQANDVPDYLLANVDKAPPYPHMSFNGRQIKEGDTVDWTDIKTGQVLRGTVKHIKYKHGTKGYVYSDQVLVEFPDLDKQRWRVSANLVVVDSGDPITPAFYAKNYEYSNPEQVINAPLEGQRVAPQPKQVAPEPTPTATTEPEVAPSLILETSTPKLENGFLKINDSTAVVPNSSGVSLARIISGTKTSKKLFELELGDYVVIGEHPEGGPNADEVLFNGPTADGKNVVVTHKSSGTDIGKLYVIDKDSVADVSLTVTVPTKKNSYQDFNVVSNNPPQKPSLPSVTPPSDQLANQAVVIQEVIQAVVNNTTDGQKMAESVGDLKDLSNSVVKKANEISGKQTPVFEPEYGNYNVKFIDGADVITKNTKKDKASFTLEKMNYDDLRVGDIVSKFKGNKTVYLQVVKEVSSAHSIVVRRVFPIKNSMYQLFKDKKKIQREEGIDQAQVEYVGYYNLKVFRPTKEFKDSGYVKKAEKPQLPVPTGGVINGISVFASETEFMTNVVEWDSEDFYESYGIPEDIEGVPYSTALSGASRLNVFRKSYGKLDAKTGEGFTTASIGEVIKQLKPNESIPSLGVLISGSPYSVGANFTDKILAPTVQWMSGPLAGETQEISNLEDRAYITFPYQHKKVYLPIQKAKELGVKFNDSQLEEANKEIEAQITNLKEALKNKLESEAKQKEISKLKTKNTNFGSGAEEVTPATVLGWDDSDFEGTPSLESVLSKMSQDPVLATRGQDVLVDASDIEDNKIKVFKVIDGIGPMEDRARMTRFAFSLNSWVTDERKSSKGLVGNLLEKIKNGDSDVSYFSLAQDLRIRRFTKYSKKEQDEIVSGKLAQDGELLATDSYWNLSPGEGATFKVNIKNSAGDRIGYYLLHRSNKDAKTPTFIGAGAKKSPIAFHNKVDLYLNDSATPEDIETALRDVGVKQARPATKEDIKVLNENKIISLFGVKSNGAVNYSGVLREKILKDTYDKYGIRAEDMEPVEKNGDINYLLPKEQGTKLATLLNTEHLHHSFRTSGGVTEDDKADFLLNLLTSDGLKSTVKRWEGGINTTGMSSSQDTLRVGANYVFMTKSSSEPGSAMANIQMLFDVNEVFRRLDFYANLDDKFGAKQNVNMVDLIASSPNLYEILFKGSVGLDMLSKLNISSIPVRENLRKKLLDNGITNIGSRTIEELLGPAPEKPPAPLGSTQFHYENNDLKIEKVEAKTLKTGDLIIVDGTVAKIFNVGSNSESMNIALEQGVPYQNIEVANLKVMEKIVGGSDDVKLLENGMQAYFNPVDGKWYKDSAFTIPASSEDLTK